MTKYADALLKLDGERRKEFWEHQERGRPYPLDTAGFIRTCKKEGIPVGAEELRFIRNRLYFRVALDIPLTVPDGVDNFLAKIASRLSPKTFLDPWAGVGLFAAKVWRHTQAPTVTAITPTAEAAELFALTEESSSVEMHLGEPIETLQATSDKYDLIVSCPPFGPGPVSSIECRSNGNLREIKDHYGFLIILESCRHLSENGVGIFIVATSFLTKSNRKGKVFYALQKQGIRVTAAIELPKGSLQDAPTVPTHVVFLQRSSEKSVFTARFMEDSRQQQQLIANLLKRKEGKAPQLGRLVEASAFRGFSHVEVSEQVEEQARRAGFVPYALKDVLLELNTARTHAGCPGCEDKPNSVYLPQMARTAAATSQDDLPEKLKSYFQLVVDADFADAEFVARMLNSPFGQLWRDTLRTGDTIATIRRKQLEEGTIYLPAKKLRSLQSTVLECQHTLTRLRSEINELESQLWRKPAKVEDVQRGIRTLNQDDRIESWLDTLPFPLASVLWVCHAQAGHLKEQYERKIHFFEALAQFLGVIHLSAFSAQQSIWPKLSTKLREILETGHLSLERATFGTWASVFAALCAETRRMFGSDIDMVFEMFKTRNQGVVEMLSSKILVALIQKANKIRNDWMGHTGIVSDRDAQIVNDVLDQHIQSVRDVFGVVWEDYELLLPGDCKMRSGEFFFNAKKVVGTRTPFATEPVVVIEPMEDGHLHLKNPNESRGLKLLPLVKVMPSPKTEENACYFYNRKQTNGIRFLSYYFEADAEVVAEFGDVDACLGSLLATGNADSDLGELPSE